MATVLLSFIATDWCVCVCVCVCVRACVHVPACLSSRTSLMQTSISLGSLKPSKEGHLFIKMTPLLSDFWMCF